jgi:hypothetical protein
MRARSTGSRSAAVLRLPCTEREERASPVVARAGTSITSKIQRTARTSPFITGCICPSYPPHIFATTNGTSISSRSVVARSAHCRRPSLRCIDAEAALRFGVDHDVRSEAESSNESSALAIFDAAVGRRASRARRPQ